MYKSYIKYATLFASILALIMGVLIMFNPFKSSVVINCLLVIALGILGIAKICRFASTKQHSAWDLVAGILFLMVCIMLLANGDAIIVGTTAGIMLAVLAIIDGISRFMLASDIRKVSKKASIAGLVISGILAVILGIVLCCMPFFGEIAYVWVIGIFLVVLGVCGFVSGIFLPAGRK